MDPRFGIFHTICKAVGVIMKKIVIASGNKGKIDDFKAIFKDFEVVGIKELVPDFDPEETGTTFLENAIIKAEEGARMTGLPVVSDDSGLSVEVLDGEPGVYSARYSGAGATDEKNNALLLENMKGKVNRTAFFTCVIAVAIPNEETKTYTGTLLGEIMESPVGEHGFGYDPLFKTLDGQPLANLNTCLLYTSDAADELQAV